jgi:hypothetical protein
MRFEKKKLKRKKNFDATRAKFGEKQPQCA